MTVNVEENHVDGVEKEVQNKDLKIDYVEQNDDTYIEEVKDEAKEEEEEEYDDVAVPVEKGAVSEEPVEESIEEPVEESIEESIAEPVEEPVAEPVEESIEEPIEEPIQETIEKKPVEISKATNSNTRSTLSFLKKTFQEICNNKEIKNSHANTFKLLEQTVQDIDVQLSKEEYICLDSIKIFEALRSSCRTRVTSVKIRSLDGLSKLFSFQLLDEKILVNPPDSLTTTTAKDDQQQSIVTPPPKLKLVDAAIDTITDCFEGEVTDQKVELQIIRCLTSCILMEDSLNMCHGQSLLKAIRTIYNIFIFSLNSSNQTIAQATLIQVVDKVFERVREISGNLQELPSSKNDSVTGNSSQDDSTKEPLTLNNLNALDDQQERKIDDSASKMLLPLEIDGINALLKDQQLAIKDAFLVFRSMAKISVKNIEETMDIRSHAVRSKLLSLHIIHSIIRDHIEIFLNHDLKLTSNTDGTNQQIFIDSVRQYLCLAISRNSASPITPVYEITLEIMWLLMANLRYDFKREIPVFLTEIYLPIADMKTSTTHQKRYFLNILNKLCNDPRIIIEFYLNYDCDSRFPNLLELIVDYLSRTTLTKCEVTDLEKRNYLENLKKPINIYDLSQLPLLSISNLSNSQLQASQALNFPLEYACKMSSLNCVVALLRSLSTWAHKSLLPPANSSSVFSSNNSNPNINSNNNDSDLDTIRENSETSEVMDTLNNTKNGSISGISTEGAEEELQQFENSKIRKTLLTSLISIFNKKPKKGIAELISKKFIADDSPKSIANFLLNTDGLDLASVGDYLGEGADKNIAIMHAFVEELDFTNLTFIEALRLFLQKFRLPGEGQKIDRFMLKFAERFLEQNPGVFAKADTAYVLAYSVIMLNTDLHSSQIKNRMTLDEFIDNVSGINDEQDLPRDYVVGLFNEIENNEIKLLSEQHDALINNENQQNNSVTTSNNAFNFFNTRDLNREAYMQVSKEITTKTENVVKNLTEVEDEEAIVFYVASHVEHVKFVFETLWMSFLASLTSPFKECDDEYVIAPCLEALQLSVRISATFGIEMARKSFIGALVQFSNLQNTQELKKKNIDAIVKLLEVSLVSGNFLKESWSDVLFVVSQVERLQLIAKGIDRNSVPDVSALKVVGSGRSSMDSNRSSQTIGANSGGFFKSWGLGGSSSAKSNLNESHTSSHDRNVHSKLISISQLLVSSDLVILVDKIFSDSCYLSAPAIIDFIKALTQVCTEELESSMDAQQPRMFSLQKMIDVCYYNMNRIRVEWTPIWNVMGATFIQIASNQKNLVITFFAIDSLRQLSMRFLNIEELQGFEFQCDFLKPFVYILKNSFDNYDIQEMCLECFNQFILMKGSSLKSGWKPILESLQYVSEHTTSEKLCMKTLDVINLGYLKDEIFINLFGGPVIKSSGQSNNNNNSNEKQLDNFLKYIYIYKEICKNAKFPKNSLRALNNLKKISKKVEEKTFYVLNESEGEELSECNFDDIWYPILFTYNDIIMNSKDMEIRSFCLNEMFEFLFKNGKFFNVIVWNKICNKILFPIFSILKKNNNERIDKFNSHDDLSVWLNTTLIQALRNTIALFTNYYNKLEKLFSEFCDILISCICQENDTIARIGRTCLQQLILENVDRFDKSHWDLIIKTFEQLFELTTANELYMYDSNSSVDAMKKQQQRDSGEVKNTIVIKCVLQLMVIELLSELFENEVFINDIPHENILQLIKMLEKSYFFSKKFNDDYELRTQLVELRVVDKIPNLLKQESSSAAVLMSCLFRLYFNNEDDQEEPVKSNNNNNNGSNKEAHLLNDIFDKIIDISLKIIKRYNSFDEYNKDKNIFIMTPVIIEILQGFNEFSDVDFMKICCYQDKVFYSETLNFLNKRQLFISTTTTSSSNNPSNANNSTTSLSNNTTDLRESIKLFLERVGQLYIKQEDSNSDK